MALFSRLRGLSNPDTTTVKNVLAPAVLAMAADGQIDDSELVQLHNMCMFSPIIAPHGPKVVNEIVKKVITELQSKGPQAVLEASAQSLSPALRETAMCFAARIAIADGVLEENEKKALAATGALLEIGHETFEKIIDVVIMMQRPESA